MAQERARLPLQVWTGPGSSCCLSASPVTAACPPPRPLLCYIVPGEGCKPGPPAASPVRGGGQLHASGEHLSAVRGDPLPPTGTNPSFPPPAELHRGWGAGTGGFMPKKPMAGMAAPPHSSQTLFPFYLGKHETAESWGQAAPCQQLQQCPAPSRTPWDGKLTHTLLAGPLGAHPAGNPTHVKHCHIPSFGSPSAQTNIDICTGAYWPTAVMSVAGLNLSDSSRQNSTELQKSWAFQILLFPRGHSQSGILLCNLSPPKTQALPSPAYLRASQLKSKWGNQP